MISESDQDIYRVVDMDSERLSIENRITIRVCIRAWGDTTEALARICSHAISMVRRGSAWTLAPGSPVAVGHTDKSYAEVCTDSLGET